MENRKHLLEKFFMQYADRYNLALHGAQPDIERTVHSFAEYFIEANPRV